MNVRFLEIAETELASAVAWYEAEERGLGRLFAVEVADAVARISEFPLAHRMISPRVRRCVIR